MGSLLKFLFITIAVFWLIKQLVRFLLPLLFQKLVNKVQNQANQQYQQHQNYDQPDGQIRVDYVPPSSKKTKANTNTVGDFVDYEELK